MKFSDKEEEKRKNLKIISYILKLIPLQKQKALTLSKQDITNNSDQLDISLVSLPQTEMFPKKFADLY